VASGSGPIATAGDQSRDKGKATQAQDSGTVQRSVRTQVSVGDLGYLSPSSKSAVDLYTPFQPTARKAESGVPAALFYKQTEILASIHTGWL
jgi:hypothetical protein